MSFSTDGILTLQSSCDLEPLKDKKVVFNNNQELYEEFNILASNLIFAIEYKEPDYFEFQTTDVIFVEMTSRILKFEFKFSNPSMISTLGEGFDKINVKLTNLNLF